MSAPKTRNPKVGAKRKAVPKSRWGKDVRADGNLFMALWRHPQSNQKFCTELLAWLDHVLVTLAAWQTAQLDPVRSRFEDLRRLFRLSDIEFDTLVAASAVGNNSVWPCDDLKGVLSCEKILKVAAMLGALWMCPFSSGKGIRVDQIRSEYRHFIRNNI